MRPTWFAGGIVIAAVAGLATGGALTSAPEPAVAATSTIDVSPGGDINRAIDQARPGDSVFLRPGTYPGPVLVDKAITLTSQQASISAPSGGAAVIVTADGVTLDTIIATCESGSRATTGIQVHADQVRVITSTALGCERGILLDGAQDAYLEGDTLLGSHGRAGLTAGLWSTRADGLTMLGNTFEDNDAAMVIASTSTPALDSTTISGGGTGISLRAVTNAIIDDTLALDITGPAVTVTGSR
ncbi:MAG: right-handed parallel beta-helix repeat-containing protein, partial [Humibacter sp.]